MLAQLRRRGALGNGGEHLLESNWAYMVMTALGWNQSHWWALLLLVSAGRWRQRHHRREKKWVWAWSSKLCSAVYGKPRLLRWVGNWCIVCCRGTHQRIFWRLITALRC